jgi:hypothetical protein
MYLTGITYNGSYVLIMCVVSVWWDICRQTLTTHKISTYETIYVISVKYRLLLPDDESYVIRNMLQ